MCQLFESATNLCQHEASTGAHDRNVQRSAIERLILANADTLLLACATELLLAVLLLLALLACGPESNKPVSTQIKQSD